MIKINDTAIEWQTGLTVEKLLRQNNFIPHLSIVKINGEYVSKNSFFSQLISDGDEIKIMHLVAGG
ncbi:MAG: sulfur carrier protein ThiS [Candidatus Cloacimonadales bacterium]